MSISLLIYLASVSGNLGAALGVIGFIGFGAFGLFKGVAFVASKMEDDTVPNIPSWPIWVFASMILVSAFLPNKETIYMMAGAAIIEDIAETPEAARIGDRLITLIEGKLDQAIGELPAEPVPATTEVPATAEE